MNREESCDLGQMPGTVGGLPPRMLWYQFTPYEAYYNIGNYTNVLALVQTMLTSTPYVEETY